MSLNQQTMASHENEDHRQILNSALGGEQSESEGCCTTGAPNLNKSKRSYQNCKANTQFSDVLGNDVRPETQADMCVAGWPGIPCAPGEGVKRTWEG